jgi:hypothetical protein
MDEQRVTLHPADFARFWEARWTEPSGAWITRAMYDKAEHGRESSKATVEAEYVGAVDVGLVHDPTVVAVMHGEGERYVLDTLRTLQGTKDEPVQLEVLEDLVVDLTRRFRVRWWRFESPQAVASVQRLQNRLLGAQVEARYPTAESMAQVFGTLYRAFSTEMLTVYPHEQLRKEALNLFVRLVGGRLKTVDSAAIHQDHVVALGMCCEMLALRPPVVEGSEAAIFGLTPCPKCGELMAWQVGCLKCGHPALASDPTRAVVGLDPETESVTPTANPVMLTDAHSEVPPGFIHSQGGTGPIYCPGGRTTCTALCPTCKLLAAGGRSYYGHGVGCACTLCRDVRGGAA